MAVSPNKIAIDKTLEDLKKTGRTSVIAQAKGRAPVMELKDLSKVRILLNLDENGAPVTLPDLMLSSGFPVRVGFGNVVDLEMLGFTPEVLMKSSSLHTAINTMHVLYGFETHDELGQFLSATKVEAPKPITETMAPGSEVVLTAPNPIMEELSKREEEIARFEERRAAGGRVVGGRRVGAGQQKPHSSDKAPV